MSHTRKKGGQRKDHKMERMREDVQTRHEMSQKTPHRTDEKDIIDYKQGSQGDANMQRIPPPNQPRAR